MIKTPRKGYIAPWSSRREVASLMGAFIVFLISCPGHGDLIATQTRHLFQQLVRLTLVFLGVLSPVVQAPRTQFRHAIARIHRISPEITPILKPVIKKEVNSVPMNMIQRHWTYIFEGKATLHEQPCANASVLVRMSSGDQSVTQGTITGPDGSYALKIGINANESDPVDWTMEAFTSDFKKVEIVGRRITQPGEESDTSHDQPPIVVNNPVEFVVSLSNIK